MFNPYVYIYISSSILLFNYGYHNISALYMVPLFFYHLFPVNYQHGFFIRSVLTVDCFGW